MALRLCFQLAVVAAPLAACPFSAASLRDGDRGVDPFADVVIDYDAGPSPTPGYTVSSAALGAPERFTGEGVFPSVVSPFSPPFMPDEIVSISPGGFIILQFDEPVADDPDNLFGVDLIIFANAGFIDGEFPLGVVSGAFGADGGVVEVSADGSNWFTVQGVAPDGLMPTMGYLDGGAYDARPGRLLSDFTRPVDPGLTLTHMLGLNLAGVRDLYRGSGGGVGVDIAGSGLGAITHVRISNPGSAAENIEIDAVADAAPRIAGDANLDGTVDVDDLILVIVGWGAREPTEPPADFDNNGFVDVDDLITVILNWGATP